MAFNAEKCLKFTALADGCTISISASLVDASAYFFTKKDDDTDWVANTITLNSGESAYCKGTNYPSSSSASTTARTTFAFTADVKVSGSIMSLVDGGEGELATISEPCAFGQLFADDGNGFLKDISGLKLPATTLSNSCYSGMFEGCSGLTSIPTKFLPAPSVKKGSYQLMFKGCTGLTSLPEDLLPATTFSGDYAYESMFQDCTGLTALPKKLLVTATLRDGTYSYMFNGCSSLSSITVPFSAWPSSCTDDWVGGVAATGTFYCPDDLPRIYDDSHIPTGWVTKPIPKDYQHSSIHIGKIKIAAV